MVRSKGKGNQRRLENGPSGNGTLKIVGEGQGKDNSQRGKGVTMDKFVIACHEAGHALAAYLFGIKINGVQLGSRKVVINGHRSFSLGRVNVGNVLKKNPSIDDFSRLLFFALAGYGGEMVLSSVHKGNGFWVFRPVQKAPPLDILAHYADLQPFLNLKTELLKFTIEEVIKEFSDIKNRIVLLTFAKILYKYKNLTGKQTEKIFKTFFPIVGRQITK